MADTEIIVCDQGERAWFDARAGAITASMFAEVRKVVGGLDERQQAYVNAILSGKDKAEAAEVAGYKKAPSTDKVQKALDGERIGDYSNAAHDYAFRLAVERIAGQALQDERYEGYAARRGHELEPEARDLHSLRIGKPIERAGIARSTDGLFGASADGLIGNDEGTEYKCFTSPEKLRPILFDFDISEVRDQIQGGMWLTGRTAWTLGLYCPFLEPCGRELTLIREYRDDNYIESMEQDLVAFNRLVESYKHQLEQQQAAA